MRKVGAKDADLHGRGECNIMKTRVGVGRHREHMPSLDFKGKQFVYTHHLTVPFRELVVDAKKSLPAKGKPSMDDNLIIQGDNLHALKALLPRYAGKVKCIYIDPPYNTGNEGWCYNDNVSSPLMQEWVSAATPSSGEDMERHDKWLSMMWPRLALLRELLADDGPIFVSIDDNEGHHLRCQMNELFGDDVFVGTITWEKKPKRKIPKLRRRCFSQKLNMYLYTAGPAGKDAL